jgi:predicted alpha/beta hydrolase family esterase
MTTKVLFLQGAGEGAYTGDKKLADSVQAALGPDYEVIYPPMPNEGSPEYALWKDAILNQLQQLGSGVIIAGHSLGPSVALKVLVEEPVEPPAALFLAASPFWGAEDWEVDEYVLPADFAQQLPESMPVFLYHCRDDEVVPFSHLAMYAEKLPKATIREFDSGGHQFNDDLSVMAADIKNL